MPLSPQQVFDGVYTNFVFEGKPASFAFSDVLHENACFYRGPNGEKCAAGIFIPDDVYDPEMEGKNIKLLIRTKARLAEIFGGHESYQGGNNFNSYKIIGHLQGIHDNEANINDPASFTGRMKVALDDFAKTNGFTIPTQEKKTNA